MAGIVFDKKMDDDIKSKAGTLEVMTPPKGMRFKVEVKFDSKIEKEASKDPLVNQEMMDAIRAVYDDLVDRIGDNLKKTDKGGVMLRDSNQLAKMQKLIDVVNKGIEGAKEVAEERAVKDVNNVWTSLAAKKKEYQKYKIKIGVTITAAFAGLITSIALMASQPFQGGASSAFAIIGMVKSAVTIGKEITSAWQTVEQATKVLEGQLAIVESEWKKSKALGHGNELSATIINQFLGISQPCIKNCISQLDTCKKKTVGVELGCHKLAKELNGMLEKTEQLKKDFMAEAKKRLSKHPSPKALDQLPDIEKKLNEYLKPFEDKASKKIDDILDEVKRSKKAQETVGTLVVRVTQLAKMRGMPYTVLDNILVFTDIALSPLNGNGLVSSGADFAQNFVPAAASLTIDKISGKVLSGTFLA